jgi:5'-deoxynucleotidase YfbR-like HD superfamily hydrolase
MLSGRRLDLLDPSPFDVEIEDIARGLARVARWNGQTSGDHAFSVAEHSAVVQQLFAQLYPRASAAEKLTALLHDAAEYVIGDMISPFKTALGIDYKSFEARLEEAIHIRFGLPAKTPPALKAKVKKCDLYCAWIEATQIAGFDPVEADQFFTAPPRGITLDIRPLPVREAEALFLTRFAHLNSDLDQDE